MTLMRRLIHLNKWEKRHGSVLPCRLLNYSSGRATILSGLFGQCDENQKLGGASVILVKNHASEALLQNLK
jgi:hypothetical protein